MKDIGSIFLPSHLVAIFGLTMLFDFTNKSQIAGVNSMISKPLDQIIEIPDPSLNEKLVPANDNHEPTALSRENAEAGSILAPRDYIEPSKRPLVVTAVLCLLLAAFAFWAWNH
jgi:hypothetical protein